MTNDPAVSPMLFVQVLLLVTVVYHLMLAVIIVLRTQTYRVGRNFAWYLLAIAAWTGCIVSIQPAVGDYTGLWLARGSFVCVDFLMASWLWFCADFPYKSPPFRRIAVLMTVLGIPWLILPWTSHLITSFHFEGDHTVTGLGPLIYVYAVWFTGGVGLGILHLVEKYQQAHGIERLQLRYILIGCIGLAVAGSLPNLFIPLITHSTRYAPLGPLAALFVTTTTTLSIIRYRLLDINVVLRAGVVYSVTIGLLALLFALLVHPAEVVLGTYLHLPTHSGVFFVSFVMALIFQPVSSLLQHWINQRLFYQGVYDFRLKLRDACNALAAAREQAPLAETLTGAVMEILEPQSVAVFLPGHYAELTQATTRGEWSTLPRTISESDPILAYARETDDILLAEVLLRLTEQQNQIGERLTGWGVQLAFPLIANQRLFGLICLGEKRTSDVYSNDDIGLLRILGKQAAIALDNARHFDEIAMMNEYHARLLEIMQDGVIAVDPHQRVITWNQAAEHITGIPATEALGQFEHTLGIEARPLRATSEHNLETSIVNRMGKEIPLLLTVTPFIRAEEDAQSQLVVFRDLTALHELQQAKMQAERYSSMGAMAASLAHEIKNPLVPIQTFAHLLPYKFDDAEFRRDFSQTVINEVARIDRLVEQMLDLVRKPGTDRGLVDLREVARRVLVIIRPECDRQDVCVYDYFPAELSPVLASSRQLYQVLMNVMTNAVQAMPNGGELTIKIAEVGESVVCRISDSGPGVPQNELARIFEPLYTTKPTGHGLGLALSYQFIRSDNGDITAECPPGSGLTIVITLPVSQPQEGQMMVGELEVLAGV